MDPERPTHHSLDVWNSLSLSENALRSIYGLHTSHEVWFALGQKYNRVSASRKLSLQRKIQTMTKGNKTMCLHIGNQESLRSTRFDRSWDT